MNNQTFLDKISESFIKFLETSPRSNKKLKILHAIIANDIARELGSEYIIKSYGIGDGKETTLSGRYMNKKVDITILDKNKKELGGIAVKFVMSNYSQNSNNYFENMLGETANIRAANKKYFQLLILQEEVPYYSKDGIIKKWEKINKDKMEKYFKLSIDKNEIFFHTPIKTLLYVIKLPELNRDKVKTKKDYTNNYMQLDKVDITLSKIINQNDFGDGIILNEYTKFIEKIKHSIKSM